MSAFTKMKSFLAVIAGIIVLALAAGVALVGYVLPSSRLAGSDMELMAGSVASTQGSLNLICLGGAEKSVAPGINPEETDEKISGSAGAFLTGTRAQNTEAQWQGYAADGKNPSAVDVTTPVLPIADTAKQTGLKVPALTGVFSADRAHVSDSLLVAGFAHRAEAGDLRGLAYNPCMWPTNEQWLVGSSSIIGSSNRLVIANPSRTNVQVLLRAFTSMGEVPLGSSSAIALPAQSIKTVSLEGLIDEDERIALFLSAESGQFAATLQSSFLDGFTPGGVEFLSHSYAGRSIVIPALTLPAGEVDLGGVGETKQSQESKLIDSAVTGAVRIVNPSQDTRTASIALIGQDGQPQPLPGGEEIAIAPGTTLDLSLDGIAPGSYAVHITADGIVSAGAYVRYDSGSAGADVAWLAARASLTHAGAYIGLGTAQLIVTPELAGEKTRSAEIKWTAYKADGSVISSESVNASGTASIDLPSGTAFIEVNSSTRIYAGVFGTENLGSGKGISWVPLSENAAGNADPHILFVN